MPIGINERKIDKRQAQTAVADTAVIVMYCVIRAVSATATSHGTAWLDHNLATTGLANAQSTVLESTSASYDNTSASLIVGISINPGTAGVWTIQSCIAEAINLL